MVPNTDILWTDLRKWSSISNPSKAFWVCALWIILWVNWPPQTEGHSMSRHIWQLCWDLEDSSRLNWLKFHLSLFYLSLFYLSLSLPLWWTVSCFCTLISGKKYLWSIAAVQLLWNNILYFVKSTTTLKRTWLGI